MTCTLSDSESEDLELKENSTALEKRPEKTRSSSVATWSVCRVVTRKAARRRRADAATASSLDLKKKCADVNAREQAMQRQVSVLQAQLQA